MTQGNTAPTVITQERPPGLKPSDVLSAPLRMEFDYTRSVGPIIGKFLTGLRERRVFGNRGSDGRVLVPPAEFDPVTSEPLSEFVEVASVGTVKSWTWVRDPLPGQPFDRPFAYALIQLDGADTALLHAVDVQSPEQISTGLRVTARWAAELTGTIHDIVCFEPGETPTAEPAPAADAEPVSGIVTPIGMDYKHTASPEESTFLRGLKEGKLIGARADADSKVYFPPRGVDPMTGRSTAETVELAETATVTTFCIVNVPFLGQRIKPPYVAAYVLLDGADIPFLHLVLGTDASEVRMGMRVKVVWKPREEWDFTMANIDHFEPTGEPDADYDTYKHHL
ncbi:Zn-ribbon domain-containing OB-fold protein [Nocardia sp. NPDC003963]